MTSELSHQQDFKRVNAQADVFRGFGRFFVPLPYVTARKLLAALAHVTSTFCFDVCPSRGLSVDY
jgi:hypothetical protein